MNFDIEFVEPPEVEEYTPMVAQKLNIVTDKQSYKTRTPIQLSLSSEMDASCSVSIIDLRYGRSETNIQSYRSQLNENPRPSLRAGDRIPPETNYSRRFKLHHPETNELVNSSFVMGFPEAKHSRR